MSHRIGFAILVTAAGLLGVGASRLAIADVVAPRSVTVELTCGSHLPLDRRSSATLEEEAQALLRSSEFNSHLAGWHFPRAEVQEEFRGAMANAHLRVTFATARTIRSVGGLLRVHEIIVRLGTEGAHPQFEDHFIDSLFTVDDKGEVVGHALYSGARLIALWTAVRDATGGMDECKLPKGVPGFS